MDEREEIRQELQKELQWVKYRQEMLEIIEKKLLYMKEFAEQANHKSFNEREIEVLNSRLNDLAAQVKALDSESRKAEDEKILE